MSLASCLPPTSDLLVDNFLVPPQSPFPRTGQAKWKQPRARIAKLLPLVLKKRHTRKTTNWHSLSFVSNKRSNRFPYKPNPSVLETASASFPLSQLPHSILHSVPLPFLFSPYLVSYLSIPPIFSSEAAVPSIAGIFRVQMALRILCIKCHSHSLKYHERQVILELIWTSKVLTTQVTETVHHYIPGTDRSQGKNKKPPQNKTHTHTRRGREHGENRKREKKEEVKKNSNTRHPSHIFL